MIAFLVALAIAVAVSILSYAIMPKPKKPKPTAATDGDNPTAEAGIEIAKFWGTMTLKAPNVLDYTDKTIVTYKVKV